MKKDFPAILTRIRNRVNNPIAAAAIGGMAGAWNMALRDSQQVWDIQACQQAHYKMEQGEAISEGEHELAKLALHSPLLIYRPIPCPHCGYGQEGD